MCPNVCIALSITLIRAPEGGANFINIHKGTFMRLKRKRLVSTIDLKDGKREHDGAWRRRRKKMRIPLIPLHRIKEKDI